MQATSDRFHVRGRVISVSGVPYPGLTVRVFVKSGSSAQEREVGEPATTDEDGRYAVSFQGQGFTEDSATQSLCRIKVFSGQERLGDSPYERLEENTVIDLTVDREPAQKPLRVHGEVRDRAGKPLKQGKVEALDRDLRSEERLGSAQLRSGTYEIRYSEDQFRRSEKDSADLVLRVLGADGAELLRTPVRFNVPDDLEWNLTLGTRDYPGASEWEVVSTELSPLLDSVPPVELREDDRFQDITFLAGETGRTPLAVGVWVGCHRLAAKTAREKVPLAAEEFFAFLRQGQPSIFSESLLDDIKDPQRMARLEDTTLRALSELAIETQKALLETALADNLVPVAVEDRIPAVLETLAKIKLRYTGDTVLGDGQGTVGDLVDLTPDAAEHKTAFLEAFSSFSGSADDFWDKVADDEVIPAATVPRVRLSLELGGLTRNHVPLVGALAKRFSGLTAGFTHAAQVAEERGAFERSLARLSRDEWERQLQEPAPGGGPIGVPDDIEGNTPEEKRRNYAAGLDRQFERAFPTASFTGKLDRARDAGRALAAGTPEDDRQLVHFLDHNPAFELDRVRLDHYIDETPGALDGIPDPDTLVTDLKSVQRAFKLDPAYSSVKILRDRGLDSAQAVYFLGRGQFTAAVTGAAAGRNGILADRIAAAEDTAALSDTAAERLYRKAENIYAQSLALYGDYNLAVAGATPFALPDQSPDAATQAQISTLPNLRTLFGSVDYCACGPCRSVHSPAAYFVDVLRYLGQRGTQGTGPHSGQSVRDVLLARRPDLGALELSCENTETPLPYVDLVNEILEDVVAPPAPVLLDPALAAELAAGQISGELRAGLAARGITVAADARVQAPDSRGRWTVRDSRHAYTISRHQVDGGDELRVLVSRQTFASAPELRAGPEYTNQEAYRRLRQEVFPLHLPFDLAHLQSRAYLDHLGVPHPDLLDLLRRGGPGALSAPQLAAARLGLTETARLIVTGNLPGREPWEFYGLAETDNDIPDPDDPSRRVTGTWIQVLGNVPVLLHRTGLAYTGLLQLLETAYVNSAGSLRIVRPSEGDSAECDVSAFTVGGLDADALDRVHRFVRLWRAQAWTMAELDVLLPPNEDTLTAAATPIAPGVITDRALRELAGLLRLRTRLGLAWSEVRSLFRGIEHRPHRVWGDEGAAQAETQYQRLFRNRLVGAVAQFPADPADITGTVGDHVPGILAAFRVREGDLRLILDSIEATAGTPLDLDLLGAIHRVAVAAKALRLTVDQLLRLVRLSDDDPFGGPDDLLALADLTALVSGSSITVAQLDHLLAHRSTPGSATALENRTVTAFLTELRTGLEKITTELRGKAEESPEAYVRARLGLLPALVADADQVTALALADGSWQGTRADRDALIERYFTGILDLAEARARLAALPAGLTPPERQQAVDARFGHVQPALEAYLLTTRRAAYVAQQSADLLRLNVPAATALLSTLRLPGATGTLLADLGDPRLLERLPDGGYRHLPTEEEFPAAFRALRLLHKNALVVTALRLTAADVEWWLTDGRASGLGWMHPGDFPVDDTGTAVPLRQWTALVGFFTWRAALPPAPLTALEFAARVLDPAVPTAAVLTDLAVLTGWLPADLDALVTAFGWLDPDTGLDEVKVRLADPDQLPRLAGVAAVLARVGVGAARALSWAVAEPGEETAESLKQTVKAKYDLSQWQDVIRPLQDLFRERKRKALVDWLVAHPADALGQTWSDSTGLYEYFLIDVEMSPCMLTSRLKQAGASAQLFVQRVQLNLEPDILASTELDPRWKQWTWMKRYRVWEANRKVFLYPENWLEPELRDEKSPFFRELEQELMQNEVTADSAEDAFRTYVENLDKVANLEIRAQHTEVVSADETYLHVVGRTRSSQGAEYYYRRQVNGARWTPWERIDLEIGSGHLVTAVHHRRLHLLWPQFLERAVAQSTVATPGANSFATLPQPDRFWEVRMFWSELKKGRWTPKVLSDRAGVIWQSTAGATTPRNIALRARTLPDGIRTQLHVSRDTSQTAPRSLIAFDKTGRQINLTTPAPRYEHLASPAQSRLTDGLIQHDTRSLYFSYNSLFENTLKPHFFPAHSQALSLWLANNVEAGSTYSVIDSTAQNMPVDGEYGTSFLWDSRRTYQMSFSAWTWWFWFFSSWGGWTWANVRFDIHYHPYTDLFVKELNTGGVKGILNRRIQTDPHSVPGAPAPFDFAAYQPTEFNVPRPWPVEEVDFSYRGAYAPYNWELFFHAPLLLAQKLAANQRFEEALEWFHHIFDPTSTDTATPDPDTPQQKFWITKKFYETTTAQYQAQRIENILRAIAQGDAELRAQVAEWRNNPFNPHLIARMRTVAYQKNVLIKYVQTLIAWADQLFEQDTIETVNEATQLYVLAASVLGPRPRSVPRTTPDEARTYHQLQTDHIDDFGNALVEIENLLADTDAGGVEGDAEGPELPRLDVLYFCVPNNSRLLGLWDTVEDRLFKIRHCMNLAGAERTLPLFEPELDPGALIGRAAAGGDVTAAVADLNAPLPLYRFSFTIQQAKEMCEEVGSLGAAMLAALEKRDAEAMAQLRSTHEQQVLNQTRLVRVARIEEETRSRESLEEGQKVAVKRRDHYRSLLADGWNGWEKAWLGLTIGALGLEAAGAVLNLLAAPTALIPKVTAGASGFGGSPHVTLTVSGQQVSDSLGKTADALKGLSGIAQLGAGMTNTIGSYERRAQDWQLQRDLADQEIVQADRQITASKVRIRIAEHELTEHDRRIEHAAGEDEFLRGKFTNQDLHDWTVTQLSTLFFQSYRLAHDMARRAERCFRYELGLADSDYVRFGSWDSLRKGLVSGERLAHDLRRLETAYYEQNRREYELTKHVSLALLDPVALLRLRQNGECFIDIPESAFDLDYPGHYFRRLKTVGLTIPCVTGPATTVACTLTLTGNRLRKDATLLAGKYARDTAGEDPRFRDEVGAVQSIATSTAQDDQGLFELSFRDERYLPFEGAGAVSSWQLRLNKDLPQFDFASISDAVLHLRYTAREGGAVLRTQAAAELRQSLSESALAESRRGLYRVLDLRREYPDAWYRFLRPSGTNDDQQLDLGDLTARLPFFTRGFTSHKARGIEIVVHPADPAHTFEAQLSPLGTEAADLLPIGPDPTFQGLHRGTRDLTGGEVDLDDWTVRLRRTGATDFRSLPVDAVTEVFLIVNYTVA
ncbi:neuraminidase-like domain-containing protein [Streptomyces sp. NPDC087844]|uniref:Tc toxin subunit A-related protein n=1 Tax=Streptomyces sp. NPDC087844 TaxID=3365805 RepID=UPI00380D3486